MIEVVKDTIAALRDSPLLLGVMLINVIFAGAGLLYLRSEQRQMDRMIELVASCAQGLASSRPATPQ